MNNMLVSASLDTVRKTGIVLEELDRASILWAVSKTVHGDFDISLFDGFDPLIACHGEEQEKSILRPRFAAILRRQEDGALRLIRHWATEEYLDPDMMVAETDRWMIDEAFKTHDVNTRIMVSSLCHAHEKVEARSEDIKAHDASILREMAWHMRRASRRMMAPSLAETLKDVANDMVQDVSVPLQDPRINPWDSGFGNTPWYVGQTPTVGRYQATNNNHLKTLVARLQEAGDHEAAGTLVWLCWHRDIDFNRGRFLAGEAVRIQEERVILLENALRSIASLDQETHHYLDSTMRQNPTQCFSVYSVMEIIKETLEESKNQGASYDAFSGKHSR